MPSRGAEVPNAQNQPMRRPRDRKATIVREAGVLFAERGFDAVRMSDIGERVGISAPAVYRHFANKNELLGAVVLDVIAQFDAALDALDDAATGDAADPTEDLTAFTAFTAALVTTTLDHPASVATLVADRRSLDGQNSVEVLAAESRLISRYLVTIRAVRPSLSDAQIGPRMAAAVAALATIAGRAPTVERPALDRLLTDTLVNVLIANDTLLGRPPEPLGIWSPEPVRGEAILSAAVRLFHERGFHGVGVDDIGAAAGISGPTVYTYYDSKVAILVDAFERVGARVAAGAHDAVRRADSPGAALVGLIGSYIAVSSENVDLVAVAAGEMWSIPASEQQRLSRLRRQVRDIWVSVLVEVRPDLDDGAARTLVAGAFPLMVELLRLDVTPERAAHLGAVWLVGADLDP